MNFRISLIALLVIISNHSLATNWYVNDNSTTGDIFCSAVGNDANAGTASAPFGSFKHALTVISSGDFIYIDAGVYSGVTTEFGLSVTTDNITVVGAGMSNTYFLSNNNKGRFLRVLANNFNISELTIRKYGYNSGGGGFAQTIEIGDGTTNYSGIVFTNVQLDQNGGSSGESAVLVKSNTSSTFTGGGATCNTETSSYSGAFTITGTNINILFENYVFVFNSGDCFGGFAGGSIRVKSGNSTQNVTVKNSFFSANHACSSTFNGMDMYIETGNVKVYDCLFDNSLSKYAAGTAIGGSIAINGSPTVYITRSKFSNHSATGGMRGCAIGNDGGTVTLDSCYFTGNSANKANDVHCDAGSITARYCTWGEVGQRAPGTFTMSFSGNPTVFEGAVTQINTTNSTYTPNPTIPSYSGVCGSVIITPACSDPGPPTGSATQAFCSIDVPTVADLAATGTGTITWYDQATGGTAYNSTDALVNGNHYYASQTVGSCESSSRLDVTVTIADPSAPTGAASQDFCSIDVPTVADLSATGTGTITWYDQPTGGTAYNSTDALVSGNHYYAAQTVGGCESDTRLDVTVTIADPSAPTGAASQDFCSIDVPTVADLVATGTGTITWYDQATGGTAYNSTDALVSGNHYYAAQTVGGCESATRLDVTVTIADPSAPTGAASQDFCSIDAPTVADLAATGTGTITWYDQATGGTAYNSTDALVSGNHYYAAQTVGGCESDTRLDVTVTIADPSAPTGAASQDFCSIDVPTVADLAATGTGTITWYDQATGGTAYNSTDALVNGNHYYAAQTVGGCESATRLDVTVTIADPSAPTGAASQDFCSIDAPTVADLVATGTGTITWYDQATGGTAYNSTDALVSGNHYYAAQTVGGCESDTRLDVTVTIADPSAPTGAASQDFCSIDVPTVADLAATGTGTITWYDQATGGTAYNSTDALVNGNHYYAAQTVGGCESATRLDVTVTIADPSAPTGAASQDFCSIDVPTVADLSATGTGTITWYDQAIGGTAYNSTDALVSGNHYYAAQTVAGCESATRLDVTVTIADPSAPTGAASQDFCSIDVPTVADLAATGTGTITWYDQATGGTAYNSTDALVNGNHYYAAQTVGGCESATRLDVTVTIADPSAPTGAASQDFCSIDAPTVADLVATGTGTITWYDQATGGTAYNSTDALVSGNHYYAAQTVGGCESDTRLDVTVTIADPSAPTGAASQDFCSIDVPTVADLAATGTGTITWYDQATGGTAYNSTDALVNGNHYYAAQTVGGCESATRLDVTVTIADPSAPTGAASQDFCSIDVPTVADLSATGTGTITWYDQAIGGTAYNSTDALVSGNHYYAAQTVAGCESATRLDVTVTIADPSAPTGAASQDFCSIDVPTVADLSATGTGTITWYDQATGGTAYNSTDALVSGNHYYAAQTVAGCESATRLDVTVTIADPSAPTGAASQDFCSIDAPTVADLVATGTGTITWYDQPTGGTAYNSTDALVSGNHYYAAQTVAGCESATRLDVTVTIADPSAPTGAASQDFCSIDVPTVADLSATGTGTITWYDQPTGGTAYNSTDALVSGNHYYAAQTVAGCESDTRLDVTVTIADPSAPTGAASQDFCLNNDPTISDLSISGSSLIFYDDQGSVLPSNAALTNGATYTVTQTINGCESMQSLTVTVLIDSMQLVLDSTLNSICNQSTGSAYVQALYGTSPIAFQFSNGTVGTYATGLEAGTYQVVAIDGNGCQDELSFVIACELSIVPEFIHVGHIGNGQWIVSVEPSAEIQIYNRWGNLVYKACPYMDDFDGHSNVGGTLGTDYLPSGTYYYIIDHKNGETPESGYIEIVH